MKREHLGFWEIIHLNQYPIITLFTGMIVIALIILSHAWFTAKNKKESIKTNALILAIVEFGVTLVVSAIFLYSVNVHEHQTYITGEDIVTVKDVKKSTNDNNYWTFESKGHTYKVTYDTNPNESELPPTALNKGDKVKVNVKAHNSIFVDKDNTISINDIDCQVLN